MTETKTLRTDALQPNDYNPNRMTGEEFAELVEEVRHLGRLPKPVVVRNGYAGEAGQYLIVDGEHNWRAAKEVGLEEVACEVIEADDFEAMRQTYKRNQHGTHDRVALGEMFKRMMAERGISNRELAKEINVSEGTVRNALIWTEAAEMRRRWLEEQGGLSGEDHWFNRMTTKQVRDYVELPEGLRDRWLNAGAPPVAAPETWGMPEYESEGLRSYLELLVKTPVARVFDWRAPWEENAKLAYELMKWRVNHSRVIGRDIDEYMRPVIEKRPVTPSPIEILDELPMHDGKPFLTPEEWAQALEVVWEKSATAYSLLGRFKDVAKLKAHEEGIPEEDLEDPRVALLKARVEKDAPAFIRDANIPLRDKGFLLDRADRYYDGRHHVDASRLSDAERDKCKQAAVDYLVEEHERYRREMSVFEKEARDFEALLKQMTPAQKMQAIMSGASPKRPSFPVNAERAWIAAIKTNRKAVEHAEEMARQAELKKTFEDPEKLVEALVDRLTAAAPKVFGDEELCGKPAREVLRERLLAMPRPEQLLLGAVLLKAPVGVWADGVRNEHSE
jgi:ParB/RepB/Spo0J family partition protein